MGFKRIVSLTTSICLFVTLYAQDSTKCKPKHSLGIYSGFSRHLIRDDVASPLIYRGSNAPVVLAYNRQATQTIHQLSISYDNLKLNSSITDRSSQFPHYADEIVVKVEYSYNRRIFANKNSLTKFFLGAKINNVLNLRTFHYFNNNSIIFAEEFNSLGPNVLIERQGRQSSSNAFRVAFYFPVISYSILNGRYNALVGKEFENIDPNQNIYWQIFKMGEFVSFKKLIAFQSDIAYTKSISEHVGFELRHKLLFYDFTNFQNRLHTRYVNSQYLLGVIIKLGKV